MAILFSQSDGSDQHYDTYEEFEQAMILMKRLNGEKVPQDLLDEAKAKCGGKEATEEMTHTLSEDILELLARIDEFTSGLEERRTKVRTTISDEGEDPEECNKFEVGDKVRVVDNLSEGHPEGTIGVVDSVSYDSDEGSHSYGVEPKSGSPYVYTLYHGEEELESSGQTPTEFRTGDIVRATEDVVGFGEHYVACNAGELLEVQTGGSGALCLVKDYWKNAYVSENLANIELVCRKEDRKDIEL